MKEGQHYGDTISQRVLLTRERQARKMSLPAWSRRALDAEGKVNGRTWRQMPGRHDFTKACNWWLWKRGLINLCEERASAAAVRDIEATEEEHA